MSGMPGSYGNVDSDKMDFTRRPFRQREARGEYNRSDDPLDITRMCKREGTFHPSGLRRVNWTQLTHIQCAITAEKFTEKENMGKDSSKNSPPRRKKDMNIDKD